jgi:phenylalanyl-tRNA synthetase beta chain
VDLGMIGLVEPRVLKSCGLERPTAACELELRGLLAQFPPDNAAKELPAFPATDRDISAIVGEGIAYGTILREIESLALPFLESIEFVTTFRGKQIGEGRKSVSLRLVFRAADRTLRSEEADGSVAKAIARLREALGAEIRG